MEFERRYRELEEPPAPAQERAGGSAWLLGARALWEARRQLLRAAGAGLLAGAALALLWPKSYESTTRLMPPDGGNASRMSLLALAAGNNPLLGTAAADLLGARNSGALMIGIVRSTTLQDRVIERFGLQELYGTSHPEATRRRLAANVQAFEERRSGILVITVRDRDARRAQEMAQFHVEELNRLVAELSTSAARREREFIGERLEVVRRELEEASDALSKFASENVAVDIPEQARAMLQAGATLQGQLIAAQSELRGLEQIYTAQNTRVRALRARVGELQRQLEKLGGAEGAAGEEHSLYPGIRELPRLGASYARLYRETRVQQSVYETLTAQYEMAKVEEAKEIPSVRVLDAPYLPSRHAAPSRLLITFAGLVLALAFAGSWVLGRTAWELAEEGTPGKLLASEVLASGVAAARRWTAGLQRLTQRRRSWTAPAEEPEERPAAEHEPVGKQ
jgi:capsule polysaccharide export protein KpsE/RkpR